jgi:hypothetical protein
MLEWHAYCHLVFINLWHNKATPATSPAGQQALQGQPPVQVRPSTVMRIKR